jgi:hydrogenase-4 component B
MTLLGLAIAVFLVGGVGACLATPRPRRASAIGAGGAVLGSGLGLVPAARVLAGRDLPAVHLPWAVPGGGLSLAIDPLSAFFLVPLFVVGAATALYGAAYLMPEPPGPGSSGQPSASDPTGHPSPGPAWLWFDVLLASMALVVAARNGLLFLVAWEMMALASFFLVVFHHEREGVPRAGWIYLVATHLGTAFLLVLFAALARDSGSLEFARWSRPAAGAGWLFALALVGFGSKAGLFPFHVWLPEAHPVAPSHVSALLSGVMVKLGLYGLLRMLLVLGPAPASWGAVLLGAGLASAAYGALAVLAQRDLKRLLAYSTVENVGIIALALGLGGFAASRGAPSLAALALAGGLLHVWNHALFKSLLFLSAGSVARGAGTLDLERLGGVLRRMPWTGVGLLAGGVAICGLPPLNGFVSEFLLYLGSFQELGRSGPAFAAALAATAGLGFVGAVAAAGFVRALGVTLLGTPRSPAAAAAREVERPLRWVGAALASACVGLGLAAPIGLLAAERAALELGATSGDVATPLRAVVPVLWHVGAAGSVVAASVLALVWVRRRAAPAPAPRNVPTWDCGYAAPTARMQYTASSFAEPLTRLFAPVLGLRSRESVPTGAFSGPGSFASRAEDLAERTYARAFGLVASAALRLRALQAGSTQLYVLYTALAALGLLIWKLA